MTSIEINNLVGQKIGLHCWDFVRKIEADFYYRHLPPVIVDIHNGDEVRALLAEDEDAMCARAGWVLVRRPKDGDICVMARRKDDAAHVGVFLQVDGGGVIHTEIHKPVVFTLIKWLPSLGYLNCRYYRPKVSE